MTFDWIHVHLMMNHFPIVLGVVGSAAAVIAVVRESDAAATWSAVVLVLAGLTAPVALLTGHRAEDEAEQVWFVNENAIHDHEERGEVAMWLSLAAAGMAAVALLRPSRRWRQAMALLAVVAAGAMAATALEGGRIVHDSPRLERPVAASP